jgi:N-acyl homoserine lactone hydrolase
VQTTHDALTVGAPRTPCSLPVPWFLLVHPAGNVVIDGGLPPALAADPVGHWGAQRCAALRPCLPPDATVLPQLRRAGVDPRSVRWVIQSHLHLDHVGALGVIEHLPNAAVLVTRTELADALDADAGPSYVRADYDDEGIRWAPIDTDGHDVLGDGVLRCWRSPGHTDGHLSFTVTLRDGEQ